MHIYREYIFWNIDSDKNQQSPKKACTLSCFIYNDWIRIPFTVMKKKSLVLYFITGFLFVKVLTVVTKLNKKLCKSHPT